MLDLDELAERRARDLNQSPESWRQAVWTDSFQKMSANMSDGEVESVITGAASAERLNEIAGEWMKRKPESST
ncbi:MAG TPA: hypothetical protein PKC28_14175 [Bdellovibrionales bacterium]|mgnify:CR=1 FL=1|nr:hypothetical protein [Bdellovibrionales bacterium]